jgi:outer membrane protein insertion porin family
LHPGDLASPVTLAKAVDLIATAYHKDGYNDALVAPHPMIDKGAGRVSYTFTVTPGEIYHVRSVTPVNLSAAQQADYTRGWRLRPGDVYNPVYIATFLKQNTALRSFESCSASFKAISEPETRLVDVTVTFVCGRPLTTR